VRDRFRHRQGSSLVESCIVMALLCLILFGFLQTAYIVAARNVLNYAAVATARARSVGLNDFMLMKVSHYASIPAAGPITAPAGNFGTDRPEGLTTGARLSTALSREQAPISAQGDYVVSVKEAYHLASTTKFAQILNYANWDGGLTEPFVTYSSDNDDVLTVQVEQTLPLVMPFSRAFFPRLDLVTASRDGREEQYPGKTIRATAHIEDHSALYLKEPNE